MPRIRLIHFNAAEGVAIVRALTKAKYSVEYEPEWRVSLLKEWRADPPDAFVIDLTRLPSHGREIAIEVRRSAKTRHVPIVFCGGEPAKVEKVRSLLPDAAYCEPGGLLEEVKAAIAQPVRAPVSPAGMMDRYEGRSAVQKLGITKGAAVDLVDPPSDVARFLGPLPDGARLIEEGEHGGALTLVFLHSLDDVQPVLSRVAGLAASSKMWALWRKKTAKGHAGVTESMIRDAALSLGLVDYKVCAVDETWSGLALARRK